MIMVKILEWNEIIDLSNNLSAKLTFKNFDGIISIGRGGAIMGAILASRLGTRLYTVFVTHRGKGVDKETKIVRLDVTPELKEGRYLLVDDQCSSGESFELIKKNLANLHLESASLICHEKVYHPDYYELSTDEEVIFPYEL